MTVGERDRLAVALADAFLAGAWQPDDMLANASLTLGGRHRWTRRLLAEVIAAYPHAPSDRPRELARFITRSAALAEVDKRSSRNRRPFPTAVRRLAEPTTMVRRPFPVVTIDDAGVLAERLGLSMPELLWFADTKGLQRRSDRERLHHYRSRWVAGGTFSGVDNGRPAASARLLEAPQPRLLAVQRQILEQMLTPVEVHPAAHGFVAGRSVLTGALPHVGAEWVISLDLESFFASITGGRVYGVLRAAGYPEPVAHLVTGLCTHRTPVRVLREMPALTDPSAAFRLRRRLAAEHLPQGSPTSPQLANLCAFRLDRRLAAYAEAVGAVYTRYADDLTFSGSDLQIRSRGLMAAVARIVREEGFRLNERKTRVRGRDARQEVTGVVVNAGTKVPRADQDRLRATLHNCVVHGPASQNRLSHPDFRAHLRGRIAWVASLDHHQGRRLLDIFARIDWT